MQTPSASYSFTMRVVIPSRPGSFARVATVVGDAGGQLGAIDIARADDSRTWRDITISAGDSDHAQSIVDAVTALPDVQVENVSDRTFLVHLGGKLGIAPRVSVATRDDLSMVYTPGVARVCTAIAENRDLAWNLTIKRHTVAIVSDGSRVLGLGDIGPEAAMPVMEGKAILFKALADVDAWPVCIDVHTVDEIVDLVVAIAPTYGGINLEDIRSPECFEIERRLRERLDIPVFHDDRHGTAVAVLAGLTNALGIVHKQLSTARIVMIGAGAAGQGVIELLHAAGARRLLAFDQYGVIHRDRLQAMGDKAWYVEHTNLDDFTGPLEDGLDGADVVIALAAPGALPAAAVAGMCPDAIVFTLANPVPELAAEDMPPNVRILATGRSDQPNQINNALVFPGLFRGALDARARCINEPMKIAAARAIAAIVGEDQRGEEYIVPTPLNPAVAKAVAQAVAQAARDSGVSLRVAPDASPLRLGTATPTA